MPVPRCLSQFVMTGAALALATMLSAPVPSRTAIVSTQLVIRSYRPKGQHSRAIEHSLRVRGPIDSRGNSRDAFTRWTIKWRWPEGSGKLIDPDRIKISLRSEIILPRLSRQIEKKNPAWRIYHQALVRHELNHFHFALAGSELLARKYEEAARLGSISAGDAQHIAREVVKQVRKNDQDYDRITDHGRSEGIRWVSNQRRIDSLIH